MESTRILGTGSYLPPTVLTNYDPEKRGLDTTHDWIVQRSGMCERRIACDGVTTSDLGYEAGVKALEMAGMSAREVDLDHRGHHHTGHLLSFGSQLASGQTRCTPGGNL